MRARNLTPLLLIILAVGGCTPQPAPEPTPSEQPAADAAPAPTAEPAPSEASTPAPAAEPAKAKAVASKPSNVTSKSDKTTATAPVETPKAAAVKDTTPAPAPAPAPKKPEPVIIPSGTEFHVVLSDPLNSGTNKAGDEFAANLAAPVYVNGKTILDRGDKLQGKVLAAEGSGRVSGKASMSIALTGVMHNGKMVPIETKEIATIAESSTKRDAGIVGGGAGVGALIGAIAGGKKGAAVGAAVGGGGGTAAVLATKGKEVDFPVESKLTFTLDKELSILP